MTFLTDKDKEQIQDTFSSLENKVQLIHFTQELECPYCPAAVRLAHKLAMENENITADMVEATEFPHLSMRYNVKGVPRTMIGEDTSVDGAIPELDLVQKIVEVYNKNNN